MLPKVYFFPLGTVWTSSGFCSPRVNSLSWPVQPTIPSPGMEAARIRGTTRNSKTFIIIVMNGDKLMDINIISIVIFLKGLGVGERGHFFWGGRVNYFC